MKTVGVLALQGAFEKHVQVLRSLGASVLYVKELKELEKAAALVIPGGESTTMGKLLLRFGMLELLKDKIRAGMPVFGTCAGMILLAREVLGGPTQENIGLLDIEVARNAYGRQKDSFEADFPVSFLKRRQARGVFIRAPQVTKIFSKEVEILASFEQKPVLVRQKNMLAASFHPELTASSEIHRYFLTFMD